MTWTERLVDTWYRHNRTPLARALWPLSIVFGAIVALRRALYRNGTLHVHRLRVPVVVVGNITAGGAGKTPLVLALAAALREHGRSPGIVSRGYRASHVGPRIVTSDDDPRVVGDEALLYANAGLPICIGRKRVDAARALIEARPDVDVVLADDGLQHYALGRTVEIAVIDAERDLGNGLLLPAGPLREPAARLATVDAVVRLVARPPESISRSDARSTSMWLEPMPWRNLVRPDAQPPIDAWKRRNVHAIAGIGNPSRFFAQLRSLGIDADVHAFPDHHDFTSADVAFADAIAIVMTEKDAVKCLPFADERFWYLPVRARIDAALVDLVLARIHGRQAA